MDNVTIHTIDWTGWRAEVAPVGGAAELLAELRDGRTGGLVRIEERVGGQPVRAWQWSNNRYWSAVAV